MLGKSMDAAVSLCIIKLLILNYILLIYILDEDFTYYYKKYSRS